MLPYRFDRDEAADRIRQSNDPAQAILAYVRDGRWWQAGYEEIRIETIAARPPYDAEKYEKLWHAMRNNEPLPCVDLAELGDGRLHIADGVHRVAVAQDLGYTHVPAIVLREHVGRPPTAPMPLMLDALNEIEAQVLAEAIGPQLPGGTIVASGHTERGYSVLLELDDGQRIEAHVERGHDQPGDGPRAAWIRHGDRELSVSSGTFEGLVQEIRYSLPALGVGLWSRLAPLQDAITRLTASGYVHRLEAVHV